MVKDVDDTSEIAVRTNYDDVWDRVKGTYIYNVVSVGNTYTDGNLTQIARNGYAGETRITQNYDYTYDAFGNQTSVSIGGQKIADYGYNSGNGSLAHIYYGFTTEPLASVYYDYDPLGRLITETHYNKGSAGKAYGYQYSSDGNLAGITVNGEPAYSYDYDTLGRLIQSSKIEDGKRVLYTDHQYDTSDRILSQSWQIGEDGYEETYAYNEKDGTLSQMTVTGGDKFTFSYDSLKRLSSKTLVNEDNGGTSLLKVDYGYRSTDTGTTIQIETMSFTKPNDPSLARVPELTYSYDSVGNITKVVSGDTTLAEYTYDSRGQLLSEDDGQYLTTYDYDTYGNIRSAWVRASEDSSVVLGIYTYTYNDSGAWKDQLTGYSFQDYYKNDSFSGTITYDVMGNPLTYFNGKNTWNFTWQYGRQLASATDGTHTITNEYDVDGIRSSKTVDGVKHEYVTLDGKIIRETYGDFVVDYFYDNEGKPYKLEVFNGKYTYTGYYVLNQQGDVIAILNANGVKEVSYEYNAWGQIKEETADSTNVGTLFLEHNALKYRGYYYDADLGLYYLNWRYYDPVIGRFINADTTDVLTAEHQNFLQYNLYAYCFNNPVNMQDDNGAWPEWATKVAIGTAVIAAAAILTVATAGTGTAVACFAVGALKGSIAGAAMGAASGAITSTVNHRITTGSWKGAGKAALNGAADGYMSGAISGFISGGMSSNACFVAGTAILTSAGYVVIEDICVGDKVWAEDPETGEKGLKEVVQTFVNETSELVHVYVAGEEIITTPEHPFYVPCKGWTEAVCLRAGDILVLQSGKYVIVEMVQHEILESPIAVYNFEVEDFHTYYVGKSSILVHNVCNGKWTSAKYGSKSNEKYHFRKHGYEVGAKSIQEYTRKATNFANQVLNKKVKRTYISGNTPNTYRYYYNQKYVDLAWDGVEHILVSYGKQYR